MTTAVSDQCAEVWTDHLGIVHEREPGERHRTLCGLNAGESNPVVGARVCRCCVAEHFAIESAGDAVPAVA
ncbi:hypothetical protein [Saccharopolyspora phatthalungensis]|uniref:Uncharacterized protein n=1 Tax=Saccharopolyspora phatthalungensis TaxID=664693 RepID=A0A840QEC9_9PSEU|nr:hypothetical protein [Saccharopolyspora phatthalungensis]MBB5158200.1 hypothetical protein [Saccharopolyspora phatthalungensis]